MYLSLPFNKRHSVAQKSVATIEPRMLSRAEIIADEITGLLQTSNTKGANSTPVSQASHAVQCAMLAMEHISDLPVIIGALLHDIGYILQPQISNPVNAAGAGAAYLRNHGFSERVCAMVEHHANARRYLATTDKNYQSPLSPKDLKALHEHGGLMTVTEVAAFEQHPYFADTIKVCRWDADARVKKAALFPVSYFRRVLWDHLSRRKA